ncbi:uncharacterized protein [Miscanthus floridulus]|uniref:uncharacterized protein n=1 Tax=Miscanthus floridulus TaxID=154761 RepID=UPI00345AAB6E
MPDNLLHKLSVYVYDHNAHSWRFTEPAPLPKGKCKFPKPRDANLENELHVYQCCTCTIGFCPYGCCIGCLNQRAAVTHPSSDVFIGGHESFGGGFYTEGLFGSSSSY